MKFFLDTNVWSYIANQDAGTELASAARKSRVEILVSPAVIDEVQQLPVPEVRRKVLRLVTQAQWKRLMPEAYSECAELKSEIKRLRPEWLISAPDMKEVNRLRYDLVRRSGGYWGRAAQDVLPSTTNETLRRDREEQLAVDQSFAIRQRMSKSQPQGGTNLQEIGYLPKVGTPGWLGTPVEYWRAPSLYFFTAELQIYASTIREWMDSEINVFSMLAYPESMNRLWLHELNPEGVPRQWLRGAFEFLQAWHKVTSGTPGDSRLATHLIDADVIVSADKNFVRFAERCRTEAPFTVGKTMRVSAERAGVDELLQLLAKVRDT
jgi:hypothetical protein